MRFEEQGRVTTWPALRRHCSAGRIRAQLDAGRWRRWGRAIVLHNGPLSRRELLFVARAHAAPGAAVAAFSALELVGMQGWDRAPAHVVVGRGARGASGSPIPIVTHRVRELATVRVYEGTVVQVPRQAVVAAARSLPDARSACGIVVAAVQQRIVRSSSVREVLQQQPTIRHRRVLLATLDDIDGGSQALSEIDFVRLCRRHGLPPPRQQTVRRERDGRRRYLDASWPRPDGRVLAVEVDGALHLGQRQWWRDQLRQNEVALGDAVLLRFPSAVVRTQPELVASQVRRGLQLPDRPA